MDTECIISVARDQSLPDSLPPSSGIQECGLPHGKMYIGDTRVPRDTTKRTQRESICM